MAQHGFRGSDVDSMIVEGNHKLLSHNNIVEPGDLMQAQYSVPFCMALALFRNPEDPKSFDASAVNDPIIRAACRKVELRELSDGKTFKTTRVTVQLKDGREFACRNDSYKGMPSNPLSREDLHRKLALCMPAGDNVYSASLFDRLVNLEKQSSFSLAPN
jgi:2-methylcitrate dehydratase PrpD